MGCGDSKGAWESSGSAEVTELEKKCLEALKVYANGKGDLKKLLYGVKLCKPYYDKVNETFDKYDADKSGSLDILEVEKFAKELKLIPMSTDLTALFVECDINKNQKFDREEFLIYMAMIHMAMDVDHIKMDDKDQIDCQVVKSVMMPIWACFDVDGNGTIEIGEAINVARDLNAEFLAAKLFDEMDKNDDGCITLKEFLRGFPKLDKYHDLLDNYEDPTGRMDHLTFHGGAGGGLVYI
mmetsp:Transcript_5746/g.6594  ORF Transcript_5746/g.6594 Transcript_5746/m.6594 type:complete len:239 (+) Transcript_5746:166-882(+)|eukprot:CAMPEP_0197846218 /NCGR_PEP_ID=MMETSP1438-20131217/2998_1 /TAXON_ID=1461541 /ORGANISM="Pterosperma sp., Strain CCMP1384" /LENGTH=238 /DNA_ID=CAMNT_0043457783 /DNA_START=158 /DNA_END=874 /DNA_ORIENTATION=+